MTKHPVATPDSTATRDALWRAMHGLVDPPPHVLEDPIGLARGGGGMNEHVPARRLPHHRLAAYPVALELLALVRDAAIRDAKLCDQALRAAKSVALNIAEAVGRTSPADNARVFGIARGEVLEVAAAIEIAAVAGDIDPEVQGRCAPLADRLYALLTGRGR